MFKLKPPKMLGCAKAPWGAFVVLCGIRIRVAAQLSFYLAVGVVQYELGRFCRSVVRRAVQIARGQLKASVGIGESVAALRPVTGQGHDGSTGCIADVDAHCCQLAEVREA